VSTPHVLVVHPGAELYGSDRMLVESVAGLRAAGCTVTVALPGPGPLLDLLTDLGASVVVQGMPVLRKAALTPAGAVALLRSVLTSLRPAWRLLSTTGRGPVYVSTLTLPTWPLLARLRRRRVVLHVHEAETGAPRPVRLALALPALLAHEVLVNSRFSERVLTGALPVLAGRSTVVRNGVPGPRTVVPPRPALEGPVRLLYVGRLSPRKGPQTAVAAVEVLRARGVDAHLRLAGSVFPGYEWFERDLRAEVAAAGLDERVDLLGWVGDVDGELASADVVLVPSLVDEPFGNTAVEALLAARPVVVSACGGLPEAVEGQRAARSAVPGDPSTWADEISALVDDWPAVAAAATAGAVRAQHDNDPGRYRRQVVDSVLGRRTEDLS